MNHSRITYILEDKYKILNESYFYVRKENLVNHGTILKELKAVLHLSFNVCLIKFKYLEKFLHIFSIQKNLHLLKILLFIGVQKIIVFFLRLLQFHQMDFI